MQFERGALPNLEPIPQGSSLFDSAGELDSGGVCNGGGYQQLARGFQRSESTGSIADNDNGLTGLRVTTPGTAAGVGRLPALLIPPKIAASLDNRKSIGRHWFHKYFIIRVFQCPKECRPERISASPRKQMAAKPRVGQWARPMPSRVNVWYRFVSTP